MNKTEIIRLWKGFWQLSNPKIWVASAVPVFLGGALAYKESGNFNFYWFFVSLAGVFMIEIGKHAINELVDYFTGVDKYVAPDKVTPYSGGRKTLTSGILSPFEVIAIGVLSMGAAALTGLYVVFFREFSVLWIGLLGFLIAAFYTLPPMKLIYNGLGEIAVGITYGPLIVLGTYLVQTHSISLLPFLASIPVGFLITNVLWINQYPDYEADMQGRKRNWVVRLGKQKSIYVFIALYALAYTSVIILIAFTHKTLWLISLLSLPLAVKSVQYAFRYYNDIPRLVRSNASTIHVYLITGILLIISGIN